MLYTANVGTNRTDKTTEENTVMDLKKLYEKFMDSRRMNLMMGCAVGE